VNLGTILADHLGDPEGAEREFRLAVESGDLDALVNLGLLHLDMGRKDEAFAELLQASKRGDPQATELVAALLAESGDPAAGDMFRRAVRQGQPGALVALATYLGQTDDTQAAEDAFKEAIALGVEDAVNSYGDWLLEEGRLDDAETLYRRALHAGDTTVWRNLGNVLAESPGRREEALQAYLLAMVSGDDAAALNAGMLLEELGRVAEGRALLAQFTVEKTDEAPA
jgi:Tfp pilus assembly protein PilF